MMYMKWIRYMTLYISFEFSLYIFLIYKDKKLTMNYIKDIELTKEIMLSQAKGNLSKKGYMMLYRLCLEVNDMFQYGENEDLKYDVMMDSFMKVIDNYNNFNCNRYKKSFPYFTEIVKRSHTNSLIFMRGLKRNNDIKLISYPNYYFTFL